MPGGGRRRGSVRRCALKASAIHFWHLHPRCMLHLALSLKILALRSENRRAVRSMEAAIVVEAVVVDAAQVVEGADANGVVDEHAVRGDVCVLEARRVAAPSQWRAREAVQAELDKISPVVATPSVTPEMLQRDREAIAERGGLAPKTAGKVATDEHSWQLYVEELGVCIGDYPSIEQAVEFAVWLSLRRERACLAQRAD